jgi:hypothetical protein
MDVSSGQYKTFMEKGKSKMLYLRRYSWWPTYNMEFYARVPWLHRPNTIPLIGFNAWTNGRTTDCDSSTKPWNR